MSYRITGLHHVTAMSADVQANIDFYTGVLGLKLVKINVNQDDPTSLHLYYGDEQASPGSLVTFFIYPGMQRGTVGWPQIAGLDLASNETIIAATKAAADRAGLLVDDDEKAIERQLLFASDPDGLPITVAADHESAAVRLGSMKLCVSIPDQTAAFLEEWLTAEPAGRRAGNAVYHIAGDQVELATHPARRGRPGAGTVHHIAFRISTDEEQEELHAKLTEAGVGVSPIIDRFYFKSIYFREPGGILLEVATDGPGFADDEEPDKLGQKLCLPPWLESRRTEIEAAVPKFRNPNLQYGDARQA